MVETQCRQAVQWCRGRQSSSEASLGSAACVRGLCAEMAARPLPFFFFFNLSPVNHQKPFLVVIFPSFSFPSPDALPLKFTYHLQYSQWFVGEPCSIYQIFNIYFENRANFSTLLIKAHSKGVNKVLRLVRPGLGGKMNS